jgi:obg-like ATPase 1
VDSEKWGRWCPQKTATMPPKAKKDSNEVKSYLGRPGNNVKIGIVGLPNVGKSTFFNCLSDLKVPAENFPFCTIDPNVTRTIVPDERFEFLCEAFKPASRVPAVLNVTDIAGLVKGAHEGAGLGNSFLSNIAAVDAIYHVCREFKDKNIEHVEGSVDPTRDLKIITNELVQKDLVIVTSKWEAVSKVVQRGLDKINGPKDLACLTRAKDTLTEGKDIRSITDWNQHDIKLLNELQLLTAKPVVYLVNVSSDGFLENKSKWFQKVKKWCTERSGEVPVIPFSASFERQLADCKTEAEKLALYGESKSRSMLPKIILAGYQALGMIQYFTCGEDEVRAWSVRSGRTAPEAAGVIHGDFERCFIAAQQYTFDDFKEHGSEAGVRAAGKLNTSRGKTYIVNDGDILFFKHNAGSS